MSDHDHIDLNDAYYIARGKSLRAIEQWQESAQAFGQAVMALGAEHGEVESYLSRNGFNGVRVVGWRFNNPPEPANAWRNVDGYRHVWMAKGNTKLGREIKKRLDAIPQPLDILKALGLPGVGAFMVGHRWLTAGIRFIDGKWLISVPHGAHPAYAAHAGVPLDARRITPVEAHALLTTDGQQPVAS